MKIPREKICLYTPVVYGDNTMNTIIDEASRLGVGGVEFMNFCDELETPDIVAAKKLASKARALGLKIPCFSVAVDILSDPKTALKTVKAYTDICSELEIPLLHHTVAVDFKTAYAIDDDERRRRFDFCAPFAIELSDYALKRGVRTVIEDQGFVFNGVKNCSRLCELSGGNIGIVADTGNIMFYDEKPADFIRAMGGCVVHAHIKDYRILTSPSAYSYRTKLSNYLEEVPLGEGNADFDDCLKAFADIGYDSVYSLEYSRHLDVNVEDIINKLV